MKNNNDSKMSKQNKSLECNYVIENDNFKSCGRDDYYDDCLPEVSKKNKACDRNKWCDSNGVFCPICCNGICTVPRMDHMNIVAEGKGTISSAEAEAEAGQGMGCGCGCKKCQKNKNQNTEPEETEPEIAFNFSIGKKFSKFVGELCIVNYEEKIFITSDKLECFHSPDHTKFVAIFHVEESEDISREVVIFASTKMCNTAPTLFVYSAPYCESSEEILMGGSVVTGTITISKDCRDDSGMGH